MSQILSQTQGHYRAKEAARYLGIATSTFWRWVGQGRLPQGTRLSQRCTIWPKEALDAFIAEHTRQGGAA